MVSATRGAPTFVYTEHAAPQAPRCVRVRLLPREIKTFAEKIVTKILTSQGLSQDRLSNIAKWKAHFDTETDPEKIFRLLGYLLERLLTLKGASVKEQIVLIELAEEVKNFLSSNVQTELEGFLEESVRNPLLKREETLAKVAAILATFKEEKAALRAAALEDVAKIKAVYGQVKVRILEVSDKIEDMDAKMEGDLTKTIAALEDSLKKLEEVLKSEEARSERVDRSIAATDALAEQVVYLVNRGMKG